MMELAVAAILCQIFALVILVWLVESKRAARSRESERSRRRDIDKLFQATSDAEIAAKLAEIEAELEAEILAELEAELEAEPDLIIKTGEQEYFEKTTDVDVAESELAVDFKLRGGKSLNIPTVADILASGKLVVPSDDQSVEWVVRLQDVTEDLQKPRPVFCDLSDSRDENGCFEYRQRTVIPHRHTDVNSYLICSIPLLALVCHKKGLRHLQVWVQLVDAHNPRNRFAEAQVFLYFEQTATGYQERDQYTLKQEECIASLAIAMAATDGDISRREINLIKDFFTNRYLHYEDSTPHKTRTSAALKKAVSRLQGNVSVTSLIKEVCSAICKLDQQTVNQEAYELCARIAIADQEFDKREEKALESIAEQLVIDEKFANEVYEREIRLHLFSDRSRNLEQQLQVPEQLSSSEKAEWLQQEYITWRKRAALPDVEIAAKANMRVGLLLELITLMESKANEVVRA